MTGAAAASPATTAGPAAYRVAEADEAAHHSSPAIPRFHETESLTVTRRRLARVTRTVAACYGAAIVVGVVLRLAYSGTDAPVYQTFRDMIPLIIALPAAFLAQAFQRRAAYVQGLRAVWNDMVGAVAAALTYTELPTPSKESYADVLRRLSVAIEGVRGFYANVPSGVSTTGWFPFEPVKQIREEVKALGFGDEATAERRADANERVYAMWRRARERFLAELEVEIPTHHHAAHAPDARGSVR